MRVSPPIVFFILAFTLDVVVAPASHSQIRYPRERLGVRVGYVGTRGGLADSYGAGTHANIHFSERISSPYYLHVRVGAIYLGDLKRSELAERFTGIANIQSQMRLLFLTGGPQYTLLLGDRWTGYTSVEAGIYSVNLLFDGPFQSIDVSDSHFGGNIGVGAMWRIAGTWNLDLNTTVHYFRTNMNRFALFPAFTDGDSNPLFIQTSVGVTIDLR